METNTGQYVAGFYLGAVVAFALEKNDWVAARTYLAGASAPIILFVIITLMGMLIPTGLQPISWS